MDLATLLGILGAFGIILLAIFTNSDTSPLIFLNIPSLLIVLGGSLMVVLMKFTVKQSIGAIKVARKAFKSKEESVEALIEKILEIAQTAKKEGLLALDGIELENEFLARGVQLLTDAHPAEVIREILSKDMQQTLDRHKLGAKVFTALGDVAPAMGMIGTLIGLIQMLSNMADPASIGPAMAVALLTTLYGAMLANMVALPIADKLALRKIEEGRMKAICIDGLLAIEAGHGARVVDGLLKVYLTPQQRKAEKDENENENKNKQEDDGKEPVAAAA